MADVDIDPFGGTQGPASRGNDRTELRPDEPMDEDIPLPPVTPVGGRSTWKPEHEQEMSFGGESQRTSLMKDYVKDLYKKLSENIGETPEEFHYNYSNSKMGNCTTEVRENP